MNLSIKNPLTLHNRYDIQIINSKNEITQTATAFNEAFCERYIFLTMKLAGNSTCSFYLSNGSYPDGINGRDWMGGTAIKSYNLAGEYSSKWQRLSPRNTELFYPVQMSLTLTIPAGVDTGEYTEIGWGYTSDQLISHALFVDAEGNPIIINKGQYDNLIITATMTFNIQLLDLRESFNFRYFPASVNILNGNQENEGLSFHGCPCLGDFSCCLSNFYVPDPNPNDDRLYLNGMPFHDMSDYGNYLIISTLKPNYSWEDFSWSSTRLQTLQETPLTFSLDKTLFAANMNCGFAHSLVFLNYGAIPLPNHNILPPYEVENIAIGVGDGNTSHFYTSVNEVMETNNQPNVTIYINNIEIDKSQYKFVNFDLKKSPFWNKILYVYSTTDQKKIFPDAEKTYYQFNWSSSYDFQRSPDSVRTQFIPMTNKCAEGINYAFKSYTYPQQYAELIYGDEENLIGCDHFMLGAMTEVTTFALFYRNTEEEPWTQVFSQAGQTNNVTYISFNRIEAHYWKLICNTLSFSLDNFSKQVNKNIEVLNSEDPQPSLDWLVAGDSTIFDFRTVGLTFTTPPVENDIITMTATLDLPYKTKNSAMTLSFQGDVNFHPNEVTV